MPKCRFCGKEIEKETSYKIGKCSYYCNESCFNKSELKRKKNKSIYKPKEDSDRLILTNAIQDVYLNQGYSKTEINWVLLMSQVKNMIKDYNYKYTGMEYCLNYMINIKEMNLFNDDFNGSILNLIPFYYDEAKEYWSQTKEIEDSVNEFEFKNEEIVINKKVDNNVKKWYNNIDISKLI